MHNQIINNIYFVHFFESKLIKIILLISFPIVCLSNSCATFQIKIFIKVYSEFTTESLLFYVY